MLWRELQECKHFRDLPISWVDHPDISWHLTDTFDTFSGTVRWPMSSLITNLPQLQDNAPKSKPYCNIVESINAWTAVWSHLFGAFVSWSEIPWRSLAALEGCWAVGDKPQIQAWKHDLQHCCRGIQTVSFAAFSVFTHRKLVTAYIRASKRSHLQNLTQYVLAL